VLYLIETKASEDIALGKSPEQTVSFMESVVLPTCKMLVDGEKKSSHIGGQIAGQRAHAIIADFPNHEEANKWVTSLPFWPFYTFKVTPLVSFQSEMDAANKTVKALKSRQKK